MVFAVVAAALAVVAFAAVPGAVVVAVATRFNN